MSNLEHEHDEDRSGDSALEEELWGAEGGGESLLDETEPGFNNREARDTLSEALDEPTDATPKDQLDDEPAPKKKSNLPFYAAIGTFAVVAVGLIGYKTGLIGGSSRKPIEPTSVASAMASEVAKKPESLIGAAGASYASNLDLLGGNDAKTRPALDAEALAEKSPIPEPSTVASAGPVGAPPSLEVTAPPAAPAQAPTPPAAPAPAPVATAPAVADKPAPATPVETAKTAAPVEAPAAAVAVNNVPQAAAKEAVAAPSKAPAAKREKRVRVAAASKPKATPEEPREKLVHAPRAAKPVRVAEVRKASKRKGRVDKDATPETKEVLAGWKLRGTWPSHGQSQLAWIADENGRLTTVSVGGVVSGAKVLSIGKRGEVVQTTAGQILP
jgi:hypothetical protein